MLSHISVLPLLHEWMQESRSVGSMIRLAADYEGSDRRSQMCWQRKTNVQAEEAERADRRSRTCRQRKSNVLVVEDDCVGGGRQTLWQCGGKRFGRGRQVPCRGRQVRLLWKTSALAVEGVGVSEGRKTCW